MEQLKRHWKWLVGIGIFLFMYWFLDPYQCNFYLERDFITFTLKETLIITGIIFFISLVLFFRLLSLEKSTSIRIMQTFAYAVLMGFGYLIWIQSLVVATGLWINRMGSTDKVTERFEITYVMKNGDVGIRSLESDYFERTENKFTASDLNNIKKGDHIIIACQKGLFGKNYLNSGKIAIAE